MKAFVLHSHDYRFLPYQVKAIRCYLPEVAEIVVVQGPFRGEALDSNVQLSREGAKALGVEIMELADAHWGGTYMRLLGMYQQILDKSDGLRFIMHGDCLPVLPMTSAHLLQDHLSAGRGEIMPDGSINLHWTWLLTAAKKVKEIADDVKLWGCSIEDEALHIEGCEPGFIHYDKLSLNHLLDEKLAIAVERFGKLDPPQTEAAEIRPKDCIDPAPMPPATPEEQSEASRREGICRACPKWESTREGCGLLRPCERHALTRAMWRRDKSACRLGRWLRPELETPAFMLGPNQIYLPDLPTLVYTIYRNSKRQNRVREILSDFQFTNWEFFNGSTGGAYWTHIYCDHAKLLRERKPPLLILEDDIEPRMFSPIIEPPEGAEIVYLGGGRGGSRIGCRRAFKNDRTWRAAYRYVYQTIDGDWMRIAGMWFTHAVLWLDKRVMLEAADALESQHQAIDTTLAQNQWRWNVVCRKVPMFWQNDGHHKNDTFDYDPPPPIKPEQPKVRRDRLRTERQRIVRP